MTHRLTYSLVFLVNKAFIHVQIKIGDIVIMQNSCDPFVLVLKRILTNPKLHQLTDVGLTKLNTVGSFREITE